MIVKIKCYFLLDTLQFATDNIQDTNGNWENRIISISSLSRNIGEDKSYEISGMTIEFSDHDRFFRTMMSSDNRYIAGKMVEILDQNDAVIYTGSVEKWEFKEDTFSISINDRLSGLETIIPKTLTLDEFPRAETEGDGTSIPIIFGHVNSTTGAVKCWRVETGKYLLADHHCYSLEGAFDKDGNDILGQCGLSSQDSSSPEDTKEFVLYSGGSNLEYITVNVKGMMDSGQLIEDPIAALEMIFDSSNNYTDMKLSTMNLEQNRSIMNERDYEIAGVIDNQITMKDFLIDFAFSFDCDFYLSKGNEIVISLLDWGLLTEKKSYNEKQITSFQLQVLPEEIRNKLKYMYRYNYADGKFQRIPIYARADSISNWGEFYNQNEALELQYLYQDKGASDVVQRFAFQRTNPRRNATVEVPLEEFSGLDISDVVSISHPGAIDEKPRKYQIRRLDIDFMADSVQMECLDINSLTGGIFILGDENIADNWEDADDYDRQYAYLCGDDGFFANGIDEGKILY